MAEWAGQGGLDPMSIGDDDALHGAWNMDECASVDGVDWAGDTDGDGSVDTVVFDHAVGSDGMAVLADRDGDGRVDRVTVFGGSGDYIAWESSADAVGEWSIAERGSM